MTVLVDPAIWPWRDRCWAHLVSDTSYEELHSFALSIGVLRVGFQGDHYDVDTSTREVALAHGAVEASSRLIVRRLRESGLRVRAKQKPVTWEWITKRTTIADQAEARAAIGSGVFDTLTRDSIMGLVEVLLPIGQLELSVVKRPTEAALVVAVAGQPSTIRPEVERVMQRQWPEKALLPVRTSARVSGYGDVVVEVFAHQGFEHQTDRTQPETQGNCS